MNHRHISKTLAWGLIFPIALLGTSMDCNIAIDLEPMNIKNHVSQGDAPLYWTPEWADEESLVIFANEYKMFVFDQVRNSITKLTPNSGSWAFDFTPRLNRASSRIVFATIRHGSSGNLEIASSALDGSDYKRLTKSENIDSYPSWSADGTRIVFVSESIPTSGADRERSIFTMSKDGSDRHLVVRGNRPGTYFLQPEWSPDGRFIVFRDGKKIFVVDADGVGEPQLLGTGRGGPAWSPDGRWIALTDEDDVLMSDGITRERLLIVRPDGSDRRPMDFETCPTAGSDGFLKDLSWSADSLVLRFTAYNPDECVYTINRVSITGSKPNWQILIREPE